MKKSKARIDFYNVFDVSCVIIFVIILIAVLSKKTILTPKYTFITLGALGALGAIQAFLIGSRVNNQSNLTLKAKPEDEKEFNKLIDIAPGESANNIDAIKINGKVYKLSNGTQITVKKDGSIEQNSIIGALFNKGNGGYLEKAPDEKWVPLFEA